MNRLIGLRSNGRNSFLQPPTTARHGANQHTDQRFVMGCIFGKGMKRTLACHGVIPHSKREVLLAELAGFKKLGRKPQQLEELTDQASTLAWKLGPKGKQPKEHGKALRNFFSSAIAASQQHIGQGTAQKLHGFNLRGFFISVMPHRGHGHIFQLEPTVAKAVRQFDVFAVHEQCFFVHAHMPNGAEPEQHTCT